MDICTYKQCTNKLMARGLCSGHYNKMKRNGLDFSPPPRKTGKTLKWIADHLNYKGTDCIQWPFARNKTGYGNIRVDGVYTVASRVMCEKAHGKPKFDNLEAAHSCGNGHKGCMNPNHLSWKTHAENERDKDIHGTKKRGEDCSFSKLTWEIVRAIRHDMKSMRNCDVSDKYGVDRRMVSQIHLNQKWKVEYDPEFSA